MMIRVDLSQFFDDHKAFCRIFLTNAFRLVRDVEEHIKNSFDIEIDFLYCGDNEYLPPHEDARIIIEGDVITVMRKFEDDVETKLVETESRLMKIRVVEKDEQEEVNRQINFMGHKNRGWDVAVNSIQTDDGPKIKRLKMVESQFGLNPLNNEILSNSRRIKQVKEKTESEEESSDSGDELQQQSAVAHKTKKKRRSWVPIPEKSMKPSQVSFRKHNQVPNEEPRKRINIINTVILRKGKILENNAQNQESQPMQLSPKKTLTPVDEIKDDTLDSSNSCGIITIEQCSESLDQSLNSDSTVSEKIKRKRIRKRKRNGTPLCNNTNSGLAPGNFIVRDQFVKSDSTPKLHLKFDDETMKNDTENEHSVETNNYLTTKEIGPSKPDNNQQNGNSQTEKDVLTINLVSPEHKLEQFNASKQLMEEPDIPTNTDRNPTVGDKLSFKILRLSTNYCPEPSSTIIATVLDYKKENEMITLDIEDGLDQCDEPLGKFSIVNSEEVSKKPSNKTRVFNWRELIEPQIL